MSNELGARTGRLVESDVGRAVPEGVATRLVHVACSEEEAQLETHLLSYRYPVIPLGVCSDSE